MQVVRQASLSVFKGADKGHSVLVAQGAAVCGADHGCDLVLTDPAVSARHFEVRPTPQGFQIADLGSTNGTFVEDLRIGSCFVDSGTVIRVGRTRIRLLPTRERVEIPLSTRERFGRLLGHSVAMRRVFAVLERVAPTDVTFLIEGESGTGKELVADSVHQASPRAEGPLVVVDCGAIPENLVESELFGHERGAFTGADRAKPGLFEVASGGTIFLDEIGEISPATQVALLRVLDGSTFRHVGGTREIRVDVRVLAATNRDLDGMVRQRLFREDLYYRLSTISVRLPALRDRSEDIALLARHFVGLFSARFGVERRLSDEAMAVLCAHPWPGNVRELLHVVESAMVVCEGPVIRPDHLPVAVRAGLDGRGRPQPADRDASTGAEEGRSLTLEEVERAYIERMLRAHHGHRGLAAKALGISERNLYRKLREWGQA